LSSAASWVYGLRTTASGSLSVTRCVAFGINGNGFYATNGSVLGTDANSAAVKCTRGFEAAANALLFAPGTYSANHAGASYQASTGGYLSAPTAVATKGQVGFFGHLGATIVASEAKASELVNGFYAEYTARVHVDLATARNCTFGYLASYLGFILATNTSANNVSNGTNYSPATTGTLGTTSGMINWT
jgi:hypothetical protein